MATTQTTALQKAHSAAQHMARIKKAVGDFHGKLTAMHKAHCDKMCKAHEAHNSMMKAEHSSHLEKTQALHKAHHDDMMSAMGGLHKILGVEQVSGDYGNEPEADTMGGASHNLQDFTGGGKAATTTGGESLTKAEVGTVVAEAITAAFTDLFKALGEPEVAPQPSFVPGGSQVASFVNKATGGVGDRNHLAPSPVTLIPVTKVADGQPVAASPVKVDGDTVAKAMNGDIEAVRALMKGAEPAPIPTVLLDSLSKIH